MSSVVPFLHSLHLPGVPIDALAHDLASVAGLCDTHAPEVRPVPERDALEIPRSVLARLAIVIFREGALWPGRIHELYAAAEAAGDARSADEADHHDV